MRLASFDDDRVGVVVDQEITDVSELVGAPDGVVSRMRRLIDAGPTLWDRLRPAAAQGRSQPLAEVTLGAPVPDPTKIVAAPVNYHDHKEEMKQRGDVGALGFFLKSPASVLGHGGVVRLPYHDRRFDHEAEVAAIIGRTARHVPPHRALDHVFGYAGLLDITMRGGEDRSIRKSFDTFTPFGPWLVTPDEFGDPADVDFTLRTNDDVRQKANTRDLIWSVARFVSYVSSVTTLLPGDVISTGTPAGVGPIHPGDVIDLDVARVGRLVVSVAADDPVASPTTGHLPTDPRSPSGR